MNTLSKIFVVLMLVVSICYLGVSVMLFTQRIDWPQKLDLERTRHADSIKVRDLQIAHYKAEIDQAKSVEREIRTRINNLEIEKKDLHDRLTKQMVDFDDLKTQVSQLITRQGELTDQLKAASRLAEELRKQLEEKKVDSETARAERDQANYELQQSKRELEMLSKNYAELERQVVELAKEKDKQQYMIQELVRAGVPVTEIASRDIPKNLSGKIMSVSEQFNVAIASIGQDEGVKVGYPFTIYRQDKFVARGMVEKVERDWCVVKWDPALAKEKVLVGDDVTTSITIGASGEPREKGSK
jgi:predicted  nucleic acid-binding Zn-ribbon protein